MKIVLSFILFVSISILAFFLLGTDKGWMLLNGSDAEAYAVELLKKQPIDTPDKFIDYSVTASNGYVTFFKHSDHSTIYGYFPAENPSVGSTEIQKLNWESLGEVINGVRLD